MSLVSCDTWQSGRQDYCKERGNGFLRNIGSYQNATPSRFPSKSKLLHGEHQPENVLDMKKLHEANSPQMMFTTNTLHAVSSPEMLLSMNPLYDITFLAINLSTPLAHKCIDINLTFSSKFTQGYSGIEKCRHTRPNFCPDIF